MKKILIRASILFVIFLGSLAFFYLNVDQHSFSEGITTVEPTKANLPLISFEVNGNEINQTKGYVVPMDEKCPRDSVTPVALTKDFGIYVKEKGVKVKKLSVDVFSVPDLVKFSSVSTNTLEKKEDGRLYTGIVIPDELTSNVEYLLKVTLSTSDGNQVYYYTRLQISPFGSLTNSVAFVNTFHEDTFDKEKVYDLSNVMECDENVVVTDYSHIDITSNMDALSYGNMNPEEIYRVVPTISEYNETYVSAGVDFFIQAYSEQGLETFKCKEEYRFQYSSYKTFLFNYDRTMESCFEGKYFVTGKNQAKLGISNDPEIDRIYCEDKTQMLFSYQGSLWHLNMNTDELTKVLSYMDFGDYDRCVSEDYDFKLLSIDQNGNADFAVYGYIGKGAYEGRNGIIYYSYYAADKRIQEKMFIPVDSEYSNLEGEFGEVSYTTESDIYYFTLHNSYYSYELETNVLKTEIEDMGDNWIFFEDKNLICYNENPDFSENNRIIILDVINQRKSYIKAEEGKIISLFGTVDGRLIYGIGDSANISYYDNGKTMVAFEKIIIAETDRTVVKEYIPSTGLYVTDITVSQGVINLDLYAQVAPADENGRAVYTFSKKDVIIILNDEQVTTTKNVTSKNSDDFKLEYYLVLPNNYIPENNPSLYDTESTVITKDTSVLIPFEKKGTFYVNAYGETVFSTQNIAEALRRADEVLGSVVDEKGVVVWRRGITEDKYTISDVNPCYGGNGMNTQQAMIQMLGEYTGKPVDGITVNVRNDSLLNVLREKVSPNMQCADGADLDDILYFVSANKPVIAKYNGYYVLITAYTGGTLTFIDPYNGLTVKSSMTDARNAFAAAGNVYYVYY